MQTLWIRTLLIVMALVIPLGACDLVLRLSVHFTETVKYDVVDIQTPSVLENKLDVFAGHAGLKIALLGDSVPFGRSMREHGDTAWRAHTLDRVLEHKLRETLPESNVYVANFGMNGALPSDTNSVVRGVIAAGADLIVADVTLRSFSGDFSSPEAAFSRTWLRDFRWEPHTEWYGWFLYDFREFFQWRLLEGTPSEAAATILQMANNALEGNHAKEDLLLTLLKARQRYSTVTLDEHNPQVLALKETMRLSAEAGIPLLLFYATENPALIDQILSSDFRYSLLSELDSLVRTSAADVAYLGPNNLLQTKHFLDVVHLDAEGYHLIGEDIVRASYALLSKEP